MPGSKEFLCEVPYTVHPDNKANQVSCCHHEQIEHGPDSTYMAVPWFVSKLCRKAGIRKAKTEWKQNLHTCDAGRSFVASISGITNRLTSQPQVSNLKERSCQSATKVKTTKVATIGRFDPPTGIYRYLIQVKFRLVARYGRQ